MITEEEFATHENWYGSFYELGMTYAPAATQSHLTTLQAIWQHPLLEGPMIGPYRPGQSPMTPMSLPSAPQNMEQYYGVLHVPYRRAIGCHSLIMTPVTEEGAASVTSLPTWVMLCVPTGMLDLVYPIVYPIDAATNPWVTEFEEILLGIADTVFEHAPFDLAVIGEEVTAFADLEQPLTAEQVDRGGYMLSPDLYGRIHPRRVPQRRPSGLLWFPRAT